MFFKFFYFIIFFELITYKLTFTQVDAKINAESGIYSDSLGNVKNTIKSLSRLNGSIKYSYFQDSTESSILIRAGTDFYTSEMYTWKLNLAGSYLFRSENIIWKGLLNYSNNSYLYNSINSSYNIFTFLAGAEFAISGFPLNLLAGYSSQDIQLMENSYFDLFSIDVTSSKIFSDNFYLDYGFLIQDFSLNDALSNVKNISVNGWNFGPQIKVGFVKSFLLNLDYKFLFYQSNSTSYPSTEHQIEFIGGLFLSNNLSLFLLVDYNIRKLNFTNTFKKENLVFFIPSKSENQFAIKLTYSISKSIKPYLKIGYFDDNLIVRNYKFRGLNTLIGMEARIIN